MFSYLILFAIFIVICEGADFVSTHYAIYPSSFSLCILGVQVGYH
jgi:hypothetical protein